ncbi:MULTISPECIES: hypothetical protein [Helcococcus]|uniref:Uncharacterized protein n=1 Tax=Helcococcus bovis TaxID=3153252 RepID=A0ABW9F768_9FIRM
MQIKKLNRAIENMKKKEERFEKAKEELDNSKELIIETQKEALYKLFIKSKLSFNEYYDLIADINNEEKVDTNKNI